MNTPDDGGGGSEPPPVNLVLGKADLHGERIDQRLTSPARGILVTSNLKKFPLFFVVAAAEKFLSVTDSKVTVHLK